MEIIIDLKDYKEGSPIFKRTASRGIITKDNKYLLIFSKYGDYKFPGGGANKGETLKETLIREVKEETGYSVYENSINQIYKVIERRKGIEDKMLEMESYYFTCGISPDSEERKLDKYEQEYDYQVTWITLKDAIERNKQVKNIDKCPWVIRETKIMEMIFTNRI